MMLTDAGPLIGLLDGDDRHHRRCLAVADELPPGPLLTTWPCFTEAMFILHRRGGHRYQSELWKMYLRDRLVLHDLTPRELVRMADLMDQFHDTPMDLGDASLVAVAETRGLRQVFTLDHHFWGYRLADGSALEPIPGR